MNKKLVEKNVIFQEMLNKIYYDFSLVVREYCLLDKKEDKKLAFCGKLADMIHNLPNSDCLNDKNKELFEYMKFVEKMVSCEEDFFVYRYHYLFQLQMLKEYFE